MRSIYRPAAVLCLLLILFVFSGCGNSQRKAEEEDRPEIALVMKSLANEFFLTMEQGARKHSRFYPRAYHLTIKGIKDERDVDEQIRIVEQFIARKVDAIVIAPADSRALVPVCRTAVDEGIVVVNIDNRFDRSALGEKDIRIPFVGPDNREGARQVARFLTGFLSEGDSVAIIEGIPTAYNAQERTAGFEAVLNETGIRIVSIQTGLWEMDKANRVASAVISEHPDLKAILCGNDSMALGAVAAVKAAGKAGEILITGFDNISAVNSMLRQGQILATADQYADRIAAQGIETALKILKGEAVREEIRTPVDLITP